VRGLRESLREIENQISNTAPAQAARAISIEAAQALLGCGRSRIFELLKSGALRRAPKLGKVVMIYLPSLEALIEGIDREPAPKLQREPAPKLKRRPAQRNAGRGERDEILKLIRRA
jgi:predicted DNA-binding transcriptional regulator AlpA